MCRFVLRKECFGGLLFDLRTLRVSALDRQAAKDYDNRPDVLSLHSCGPDTPGAALSAPTKVFLVLTRLCNLQCSHCLNESGPGRREMLRFEDIEASVGHLKTMGVFEVGLNGGEPLMHPDFCDIVRLIQSGGLATFLNTNGVLNDSQVSALISLGIDTVKISIDGLERIHDRIRGARTFRRAIDTVKALKSAGTSVHLNMTLSQQNLQDVLGVIELAESLNCNVKIAGVVEVGRARAGSTGVSIDVGRRVSEEIDSFIRRERLSVTVEMTEDLVESDCLRVARACNFQYTVCGNRRVHMSIDVNGDVYNTGRQTHFERVGPTGNIRLSSIADLWRVAQLNHDRAVKRFDYCRQCDSGDALFESFTRAPGLDWWK